MGAQWVQWNHQVGGCWRALIRMGGTKREGGKVESRISELDLDAGWRVTSALSAVHCCIRRGRG